VLRAPSVRPSPSRSRSVTCEHRITPAGPELVRPPRDHHGPIHLAPPDPSDEAAYVPRLEEAGFLLHVREPDWHEHRFFRASDPDVQIHVFAIGSDEAERMLLFRDRVRSEDAERELYEETKRRLAARSWDRVQDYADAKSAVVEAIIARARTAIV
jgi:hypothetical protein